MSLLPGSPTFVELVLLLAFLPSQLYALHCYRCLSLDCPSEANDCEEVREFVVREIRNYYHISTYLPPCLDPEDKVQWRLLELQEEQCPKSERHGGETCSAGRIQVKTYSAKEGKAIIISHATVLGCIKENLLGLIRDSKTKTQCNLIAINGTTKTTNLFHKMQLEHCSEVQTLCTMDFCVNPDQSVVKSFIDNRKALARFDYGLIIGIISLVVVVFAAIIGASICTFPINRPSNLPKASENANLVGITSSNSTTQPLCLTRSSIEE